MTPNSIGFYSGIYVTTKCDMVTVGLTTEKTLGQTDKKTYKQTNKQTDQRRRKDYSRHATITNKPTTTKDYSRRATIIINCQKETHPLPNPKWLFPNVGLIVPSSLISVLELSGKFQLLRHPANRSLHYMYLYLYTHSSCVLGLCVTG